MPCMAFFDVVGACTWHTRWTCYAFGCHADGSAFFRGPPPFFDEVICLHLSVGIQDVVDGTRCRQERQAAGRDTCRGVS